MGPLSPNLVRSPFDSDSDSQCEESSLSESKKRKRPINDERVATRASKKFSPLIIEGECTKNSTSKMIKACIGKDADGNLQGIVFEALPPSSTLIPNMPTLPLSFDDLVAEQSQPEDLQSPHLFTMEEIDELFEQACQIQDGQKRNVLLLNCVDQYSLLGDAVEKIIMMNDKFDYSQDPYNEIWETIETALQDNNAYERMLEIIFNNSEENRNTYDVRDELLTCIKTGIELFGKQWIERIFDVLPKFYEESDQDFVCSHLVSYLNLDDEQEFEWALACFLSIEHEGYCHDAAERIIEGTCNSVEGLILLDEFYQSIPDDKLTNRQIFWEA
jgi:hypothetical protein